MQYIPAFESDKSLYHVGTIKDGSVLIERLRRNQFPPEIVHSYFNRALNRGRILNFNCFYTGMQCWVGRDELIKTPLMRFRLSREHLASRKIALNLAINPDKDSNLIGVSSYFNYKMGHIPLALKLWLKKELEQYDYPRTELTQENSYHILDIIISLQNKFLYQGKYPWQLGGYEKNHLLVARSIYQEMMAVDKEFLLLGKVDESTQWLKEYEPSWIEKFIQG